MDRENEKWFYVLVEFISTLFDSLIYSKNITHKYL
jgi:hypothetical protein